LDQHTYEILYRIEEGHWWHAARRNMVLDWIKQSYPARHDLKILDAGCGTGLMLQQLRELGTAEGVDISEEALDFCRRRGMVNVRQADVHHLPYDASTYDVVTALDVLEHVDDDVAVLDEFARVLRAGGRAYLFVPAHKWLWSLQDEVSHHRRRYTAKTLREALSASNLTVERLSYVSTLLLPVIFLGRQWLKVTLRFRPRDTENDLHPAWSNGILRGIFESEIPMLRRTNMPFGASLLCTARKAA
jgi:SAM-dependent methyltransferase